MITWLLFMLIVLLQYFLMFFVGSHWSIDILAEAVYQVISLMIFLCLGACNARTVHQCHHEFLACVMLEVDSWIKKFAREFGILASAATVSEFHSTIYALIWLEDLKFDHTQDGGLELWGMLQIPIQPDIFLQQLTVDGHIFISWIDRCCHSSTGDQQIKLLSLDGFILGYSLFRFRFEWHFLRIVFSYILTNAAKWSVLVIFTIIFFQLFCPKRRDDFQKDSSIDPLYPHPLHRKLLYSSAGFLGFL